MMMMQLVADMQTGIYRSIERDASRLPRKRPTHAMVTVMAGIPIKCLAPRMYMKGNDRLKDHHWYPYWGMPPDGFDQPCIPG